MNAVMFQCSEAALQHHRDRLAREMKETLGLQLFPTITTEILADQDVGVVVHPDAEWVVRDRGYRAVAAIQLPIDIDEEDSIFWASYRDVWRVAGRRVREFSSSDITFFRGAPSSMKTQIFRAEWRGPQKNNGRTEFSPPLAAHPHWQFDYPDDLIDREYAIAQIIDQLTAPQNEVEEFTEAVTSVLHHLNWWLLSHEGCGGSRLLIQSLSISTDTARDDVSEEVCGRTLTR